MLENEFTNYQSNLFTQNNKKSQSLEQNNFYNQVKYNKSNLITNKAKNFTRIIFLSYHIILSLFIIFFFNEFEFIKTQDKIEQECIKKNRYSWQTETIPSECTSVDFNCCYIDMWYKLPNFEVKDKYCFVNYVEIEEYKKNLTRTIYQDINRYTRKTWHNYYKLDMIGSNLNYKLTDSINVWCPLDCMEPDFETGKCDPNEGKPTVLDLLAQELGKAFIEEQNKPIQGNCYNLGEDKECRDTGNNGKYQEEFLDLEKSLNLQYGYSKCFTGVCNSTVLEHIAYSNEMFIGNKNLDLNEQPITPSSCTPMPQGSDLIRISVVCPDNYKAKDK
jgi:hypothetical protein